MGRRFLDPAVKAEALKRMVDHGLSSGEVARELGVHQATVCRWRADAGLSRNEPLPPRVQRAQALAAVVASAPRPDAPPTPVEPDPNAFEVNTADMVGTLRMLLQGTLDTATAARRDGNHTASQRGYRDAATLAAILTRLERENAKDTDALRITRVELEQTAKTLRERARALLERPLTCAVCSREIAINWGREVKPLEDG